jgi:hypothetical protein
VVCTLRVDPTQAERFTNAGRGEVERAQNAQNRRATETE